MDELVDLTDAEREQADEEFWRKSQPQLGNALSLIQQGIELFLKGRIAEVSPFLLIVRDPREYPKANATGDIPFSEFRSIDAADLVKISNAVCSERLGDDFRTFFDEVRRQRNSFIHGVGTPTPLSASALIIYILRANDFLRPGERWASQRISHVGDDEYAGFGIFQDYNYVSVVEEVATAVRALPPAANRSLLGFDPRRQRHICFNCWGETDSDRRDDFPQLAQLLEPEATSDQMWCCVCDLTQSVLRKECLNPDCHSSVFAVEAGATAETAMCLKCSESDTRLRMFGVI